MGRTTARSYGSTMQTHTPPQPTSDTRTDAMIAALESGDIDAVVACYAEDGRQIHPLSPDPIVGRAQIRESDGALMAAFPDVRVERRTVAAVGTTLVIELVLAATNTGDLDLGDGQTLPATGRTLRLPCVWVLDLDAAGLITEERAYFDTAEFFRQLGLQD